MGGELWKLDDTQLMAETLAVSAEIHTLQVQRVDLMIAMYERDTVTDHGYRSPAHWLAAATNLEIGECHRIESLARLLRLEPEVRTAYSSGLLDAEKARQIAYFCQHYPRTMNPCDFDKARTILIDHASDKVATKATVRALIHRLEHLYSTGDGPPPGEDTTRNELFVSTTLHGRVVIKGDVDAVTGARLRHLLSPLSAPRPETNGITDDRPASRRNADAFDQLLQYVEAAGLVPVEGGVKPHVTITASITDLTKNAAVKELFAGSPEYRYATEPWAGPLSIDTARMLACDCHVTRILLDEHGVPLAHGRTHRTATTAQRRALAVRDGGCSFPGCSTPPAWADAHHIDHWVDGGDTDLDNLVMLCGHHHRLMHHTEWEVEMTEYRRPQFIPPASVDLFRTPIPGNRPDLVV
ncbi:HNH endonuclease [Rhodococcus sp. SMB37]|uniref:HNH endonuclease signature motif containing protein n=1 Tax=Rhodococcus sp. SMB37 TaxID=2512213 RepID=UPI001047572C|nr:HNH endonuclease signature motif containing protein [Rhodococcus sp. SMB37]TCN57245.1 HNH endonuclease [Rhodococcus sp. SMB37]